MEDQREKDIQILCKVVIENAVHWESSNDLYYYDRYRCIFCDASVPDNRSRYDVEHKLDCPVLIAKDLSAKNI